VLFDRLVFHPQGTPVGIDSDWSPSRWFASGFRWTKTEREYLARSQEFAQLFLLTDEITRDPEAFYKDIENIGNEPRARQKAAYRDASEQLLRLVGKGESVRKLQGRDLEIWWDDMKRLPFAFLSDFRLFEATHEILPEAVGILSDMHDKILAASKPSVPQAMVNLGLMTRLENLSYADFGQLSWRGIFELRESGLLGDFRDYLAQFVGGQSSGQVEVDAELLRELWSLVRDVEPNLPRTYLSALAGNIPFPTALNPVSVLLSANEIRKKRRLKKRYRWLFFIQQSMKR